MNYQNVGKII